MSVGGEPYSLKATTYLNHTESYIEFHIPNRCENIIRALNNQDKILLKYSTEYAEVSSEWSVDVPKEKRI